MLQRRGMGKVKRRVCRLRVLSETAVALVVGVRDIIRRIEQERKRAIK